MKSRVKDEVKQMGYRTQGSMAVFVSAVPERRQMERIKVHFSLGVIIGDNDGCG